MNSLVDLLIKFKTDPTVVVELYPQLAVASFTIIVRKDLDPETIEFRVYPSKKDISCVPLFTSRQTVLPELLDKTSETMNIRGPELWGILADLTAQDEKLEIELDPGQNHGIRIGRTVLLGILHLAKQASANEIPPKASN